MEHGSPDQSHATFLVIVLRWIRIYYCALRLLTVGCHFNDKEKHEGERKQLIKMPIPLLLWICYIQHIRLKIQIFCQYFLGITLESEVLFWQFFWLDLSNVFIGSTRFQNQNCPEKNNSMSTASAVLKLVLSDIKKVWAVPAVLYGTFSHSAHSKCLISSHTYVSLPLAPQSRISAQGTLLLVLEFKKKKSWNSYSCNQPINTTPSSSWEKVWLFLSRSTMHH